MKRMYELHEHEYQRMAASGVGSWMERQYDWAVDPQHVRIFEDMLAQTWCPQSGSLLEIGCGTGPILRWFKERGFHGTGIDVSETAIRMARAEENSRSITYRYDDICHLNPADYPRFRLCIDGQCLHCLTSSDDRAVMYRNVRQLLEPDGVFLVLTMCSPADRKNFRVRYAPQRLVEKTIYAPFESASDFFGMRVFNGRSYVPVRFVPHWKAILRELKQAGFRVRLVRYAPYTEEEPCGALAACVTPVW